MKAWVNAVVLAVFSGAVLLAQQKEEAQPLGLLLWADGARVRRVNHETALSAQAGDLLYSGDSILTGGSQVTLLFCPASSSIILAPGSEAIIEAKQVRLRTGNVTSSTPQAFCSIPAWDRSTPITQEHYGVSLTRGVPTSVDISGLASRIQQLGDTERAAILSELGPIDNALAANANDIGAHVARAAVFEKFHLDADALNEYRSLATAWPEAAWVRSRLLVHEEATVSKPVIPERIEPGKVYALLIGISKYERLPKEVWLNYAHEDALLFYRFLRSPRGGAIPKENIILLTDEHATTPAIRNAFETLLKVRAAKNDSIILFVAAHGMVESSGDRNAYIVTSDSDPEYLSATALPMRDVQKLVRDDLSQVGRMFAYIDVCRAGNIGTMKTNTINSDAERLSEIGQQAGDLFMFLASRAKEVSYESAEFGGGHGAFSYFLMDALNGGADSNQDGAIGVGEVIDYVRDSVRKATRDRQHPRDLGNMGNEVVVSTIHLAGLELPPWKPKSSAGELVALAGATRGLGDEPQGAVDGPDVSGSQKKFDEALAAGKILPDDADGAFAALIPLRRELPREAYLLEVNKLRVALENEGQRVLLRYLAGEQNPPTRVDFARGAAYFRAAEQLTPESLLLDARAAFFEGRAAVFDKAYPQAIRSLERALRLDPQAAYAYNALGIAYLEQASYQDAIRAFRDAIRHAPSWAYPLHNLALAYTQMGDYTSAIRSYRLAMELAPQYAYLPYNLGLLYQRLNRSKDAEAAYKRATMLAPNIAETYNALGYLRESQGKLSQAEDLYRQAIRRDEGLLAARQNLAVLVSKDPKRIDEAIDLWHLNLSKQSDYLPSRLSLARALARVGRLDESVREYAVAAQQKPEYIAVRLALADLYQNLGNLDAAAQQLQEALQNQPTNPVILERQGDIEAQRGHIGQATSAYQAALAREIEKSARKRIQSKMNVLHR